MVSIGEPTDCAETMKETGKTHPAVHMGWVSVQARAPDTKLNHKQVELSYYLK